MIKRLKLLFSKNNWNLLKELIVSDFKTSDYNSFLGVSWSLIGPGALLLVMYMIFKDRLATGIAFYPLYLLVGIVCFNFFATTIQLLIPLIRINRELLLNSTIPVEFIIVSRLFTYSVKFIFELFICLLIGFLYHAVTIRYLALLIPLIVAYIGLVLGISLVLSLIYCFISDIIHIWIIASRILFFITPIFYQLNSMSKLAQHIVYLFNPITPFVLSFRNLMITADKINSIYYSHSLFLGILLPVVGYLIFINFKLFALERS